MKWRILENVLAGAQMRPLGGIHGGGKVTADATQSAAEFAEGTVCRDQKADDASGEEKVRQEFEDLSRAIAASSDGPSGSDIDHLLSLGRKMPLPSFSSRFRMERDENTDSYRKIKREIDELLDSDSEGVLGNQGRDMGYLPSR